MSNATDVLDLVKVKESEGTKANIVTDGCDVNDILIGAIKEPNTPKNRDIWRPVYSDKLDEFHNEMDGEKVHGNDEESIANEIARLYPSPPPGTFRVVHGYWSFYALSTREDYYGGSHKVLHHVNGWGVFLGDIGIALPGDLEELRQLSEAVGSVLVDEGMLQTIMQDHLNKMQEQTSGVAGRRNYYRVSTETSYEREGFTYREHADGYIKVRYNPTVRKRNDALKDYQEKKAYREKLCCGKFGNEEELQTVRGLASCLSPNNWHIWKESSWSCEMKSYTYMFKDTHVDLDGNESAVLRLMEIVRKLFGRKCTAYRNSTWVGYLEKLAPYIAGWNVKYGEYRNPKKVYLRLRRESNWQYSVSMCWQEANMFNDKVDFIRLLERECRACKVAIPKLPPIPPDPRKKNRKKKRNK